MGGAPAPRSHVVGQPALKPTVQKGWVLLYANDEVRTIFSVTLT